MSQTVITSAFEQLKAQEAANGGVVILDEFVFANIPNLDITSPVDRGEGLPDPALIVHRQAVGKTGMVNNNAVVYSVVMGADVGDFDFNWVGLVNSANNVVAMIVHAPTQKKIKTATGQQGNVLTRSFLMEYNGASEQTQIITPADTWQIDFTARLNGVDERIRLENIDIYGEASFFEDGFQVLRDGEQYSVKKGAGYVSGVRAELVFDQLITVSRVPTKVWLDVSWRGTLTSVWKSGSKLTVADHLENYTENDEQHYVFALAEILADGSVVDLRAVSITDQISGLDLQKYAFPFFNSNKRVALSPLNQITPLMFGVDNTGKASVNAGLEEMFLSGHGNYYIPKGDYLLTDKLRIDTDKNISVTCEMGAKFILADNVRKNMLVFVGNSKNTFKWSGGEIDGNWEGQGPEELIDGRINDVSHGLIVSMFYYAEICDDLYVHDCMGHHINHGGNHFFHAHDIEIKSHLSKLKPLGGARGDGITGCSRHVLIERIRGFSTDDFVAVFSGIPWVEGIGAGEARKVESVIVRNLRPWFMYDADGVTKRYTWHACTIGNTNGQKIDVVDISGINGQLQSAGIRVNTYTGQTSEYYGSHGSVSVTDCSTFVNGQSDGGFTDKLNAAHVCVGWSNPNASSLTGDRLQTIDSVKISGIKMQGSAGCTAGVTVGHARIKSVDISNISATYDNDTDYMSAVNIMGQNDIDTVTLNGISQQATDSTAPSVKRNRMCVTYYYGGNKVLSAYGSTMSSFKNTNNYTGNTLFYAGDLYPNNVALLGYDFIVEAPKNFTSVAKQFGVFFTDRYLGRVNKKGKTLGWTLEDWMTSWDSANFGRPSAYNMPGFANISDWGEGTVIPVVGSPYHECTGWVCRSGTPTFQLLSPVFTDFYGEITPSWNPVGCTPGVEIITHIPSDSAAAWPVPGGGMVKTSVSISGTGAGTVMEFTSWSLQRFARIWQTGNWTDWKKLSA
ncbi:TPA: phage tail protein [Raoultella ornithinolytica]|nr:phage tail protein [Raoultella ornithinolytica]